jgi:hypothetical protein
LGLFLTVQSLRKCKGSSSRKNGFYIFAIVKILLKFDPKSMRNNSFDLVECFNQEVVSLGSTFLLFAGANFMYQSSEEGGSKGGQLRIIAPVF